MPRTPIVGQISWLNAGMNLLVLTSFAFVGWSIDHRYGIIGGAIVYLALSLVLRKVVARHHRQAITYCKRREFHRAIPEFRKSLEFFRRHPWIDDFRAVTMLSASGMCYREMALASLGFCYAQIGDGNLSRQHYEECLREYPHNGIADAALRIMDAARNMPIAET